MSKILQTKKELEGEKQIIEKSQKDKTTLPVGIKQINTLRESIQLLCQSTNPLGKTMDYLQEDVDAMNKELAIWKRESDNYANQAKEQEKYYIYYLICRITKETIGPLEEKLATIEKSIQEQVCSDIFTK